MSRRPHSIAIESAQRLIVSLALAGVLLPWASVPAAPVRADHQPDHDPEARLEFVIKKFIIHDDSDWWFGGDISIWLRAPQANEEFRFDASSGESEPVNRTFPETGNGFPVSAGRDYEVTITGREWDDAWCETIGTFCYTPDDYLGELRWVLNEQNGWDLGARTERALLSDGSRGNFSVEYEIRRAPLPDLRPTAIRVFDNTGDVSWSPSTTVRRPPGRTG